MLLHASTVAINGRAILLAGAPGAGKSDLALRLIDGGAALVADDQTELHKDGIVLFASPPSRIAGLIEARHVGLLHMPHVAAAPVALYVELAALDAKIERLPEPSFEEILGIRVRRLVLPAFAASTPAKIHAALKWPDVGGSSPARGA